VEFPGSFDPVVDGAKFALQGGGEVAPRGAGSDDDSVDDLADSGSCLRRIVGMVKHGGQTLDPAPEGFGNAGMNVENILAHSTGGP